MKLRHQIGALGCQRALWSDAAVEGVSLQLRAARAASAARALVRGSGPDVAARAAAPPQLLPRANPDPIGIQVTVQLGVKRTASARAVARRVTASGARLFRRCPGASGSRSRAPGLPCEAAWRCARELLAGAPRARRIALKERERVTVLRQRPAVTADQVGAADGAKPLAAQMALHAVLVRVMRDLAERSEVRNPIGRAPHRTPAGAGERRC